MDRMRNAAADMATWRHGTSNMPGPLYLQAAARNAEEEKAEMDGDMIFVNSLIT